MTDVVKFKPAPTMKKKVMLEVTFEHLPRDVDMEHLVEMLQYHVADDFKFLYYNGEDDEYVYASSAEVKNVKDM